MNEKLTKITFDLDPSDWHGRPSETLWAEPVESDDQRSAFRLRNSPFFARGVSFLDTVRAVRGNEDVNLDFVEVIERGGHSTYMLLVSPGVPEFQGYWNKLEKLGCTFESKTITTGIGEQVLYSVDVPASSDIYAVYSLLEVGEKNNIWMYQKGHLGHRLKAQGESESE